MILKNCRICDVRTGRVRTSSVEIANGLIQTISKKASGRGIDLKGAHLLPGLISCHTHLTIHFPFSERNEDEDPVITALRAFRRGQDAIQAGITTVRTVSELHRADISLRQMIAKGWVTGPRIFSAGRGIAVSGGHGSGFGVRIADGADQVLKTTRQELAAGANHIKLFITGGIAHRGESFEEPQMTFREMEAAVVAASSKGTYVTAHAGAPGPIQEALRAGLSCFEHGYILDRKTARAMKKARAVLVPTLCVTRSADWMRQNQFEDWTIQKALEAGVDHLESIQMAVGAGVRLVNGTDIPPGDLDGGVPVAIREMEHMVQAGLTPLEAVRASTLYAAELLADPQLGVIEEGCQADLIALPGNPFKDIGELHGVHFVMLGGTVIRDER